MRLGRVKFNGDDSTLILGVRGADGKNLGSITLRAGDLSRERREAIARAWHTAMEAWRSNS
jgi:hypothetical protein